MGQDGLGLRQNSVVERSLRAHPVGPFILLAQEPDGPAER